MILNEFYEFIKAHAGFSGAISVMSAGAGILLGNWLAISRDRKNRRIEVKQRVREGLLNARRDLRPVWSGIAMVDEDLLTRMLPRLKRTGFRLAVDEYRSQKADCTQDAYGGSEFRSPDAVASAIDKLLPYTSER